MANLILSFASRTNKTYEVRIGGVATGEYLTPAPEPFTINEDTDRDIFKNVRQQTGYVRFIDTDGTVWKNVIPTTATDRPVSLYETTGGSPVLKWEGYIKPEVYTASICDFPGMIELPVVGKLGVIGRNMPSTDYVDSKNNLAYLLFMCFTAGSEPMASLAWWSNLYIQGGSIITTYWLKYRPQWAVFFDQDSETKSGFSAKYNWLEILEHVCTFFGWSCRTYSTDIYLCSSDDTTINSKFVRLTPEQLVTIADGGSSSGTIVDTTALNMGGTTMRADSTEEMLQGVNSCEVVADISKIDPAIEVPWDDIEEYIKAKTINKTLLFGSGTNGIWRFQREPTYFTNKRFGRFILSSEEGGSYAEDTYTKYYKGLFDESQYYEGSISLLRNYSLQRSIYIQGMYPQDKALVTIESIDSYNFQSGILVLSGKTEWKGTSGDNLATRPANGTLYMRFHVGDYVWNGTSWVIDTGTDSPWLAVSTGTWPLATSGAGTILNTRNLDDPYPAFNGYGMPVSGNIGGKVKVEIKGFIDYYGSLTGEIWISDLNIEFLRSTSVSNYNDRDSNRYKAVSGKFIDGISISTIFASDDGNAAGTGILLYSDYRYLTTIPYGVTAQHTWHHPEQHLADRIAKYYGAKVHNVKVLYILDGAIRSITPLNTVTIDGKTYITASISMDVGEDLTTLILVEI